MKDPDDGLMPRIDRPVGAVDAGLHVEQLATNTEVGFFLRTPTDMLYMNPSLSRIFGADPDDPNPSVLDIMGIIHPDDRDLAAAVTAAADRGESTRTELRIVLADGTIRWIGATNDPVHTGEDQPDRVAGTITDITQRRAADDALLAARAAAESANEAKNAFMSRTSHELRTPLNAILGFAQLLKLSELSADDRDSADHILAAGQQLLALINELIDIARVESGELRLSMEDVRVDSVAEEVANLLAPLAAERRIQIELANSDGPLTAHADEQRLRQVLVNLASNAIKYNHDGGSITIGCRPDSDDGHVLVTVSDSGPGLTAEEIARIFVPFDRLEAAQHGIEGTGIGLPLSLGLTQAMNGVLDVSSIPGRGSTFTVRLSRGTVDPANSTAHSATAAGDSFSVLSIEDNLANALLIERLFHNWSGATLHAATTAEAGLALAAQQRPDVVLLDLHLPDLSGEEVLTRLQATGATQDIVVLSADATPGTIRRLLGCGVSAYLTKPVDLRELRTLVNRLVADRRIARGSAQR